VAPPERAAACLRAVRENLVSDAGALLLAPAYDTPDETIGYITRYAPGLRENGGVYTHARRGRSPRRRRRATASWWDGYCTPSIPATRTRKRYWAEPYVLPGNVDGPESPLHGRAGWTWYTGAAAWLPRVLAEWVLGVRPTWEGPALPTLPAARLGARAHAPPVARRHDRRAHRARQGVEAEELVVEVGGRSLPGGVLTEAEPGARIDVRVVCG
jgi:cellobiose phosphorylase